MAVTILKLNFRGVYFEVDVNVLQRAPESRLANIARGKERVPMDNEGRHFIDRNPLYFHHILNYYNSGRLEFPPQYSWESIKNEIDFWQIDLNPLTKNSVLRYEKQKAALEQAEFINNYYSRYDLNAKGTICRGCSDAFRGMYEFFDVPRSSIPAMEACALTKRGNAIADCYLK
ncbi:hypothetical protein CAPTEDRAFT_210842 [Capitella teleta]|uniref:Potassium channel tetramerisation-type BTB domain-containing protein n=1 Tax=Capitella teleta TaxID=283909 RepID=R7U870_CAPTE|nr:hypothetical protein CAPTEDRAFT_210842 [Capitella teleta]|eukprot:ELT99856.1 hypothetical protein CAPTEDRAFT_210842 [Capitella teleta]